MRVRAYVLVNGRKNRSKNYEESILNANKNFTSVFARFFVMSKKRNL